MVLPRIFVMFLFTLVPLLSDPYYTCYEYPREKIRVTPDIFDYKRVILAKPTRVVEYNNPYLLLTDKKGDRALLQQILECNTPSSKGTMDCGVECDGGTAVFDRHMSLTIPKEWEVRLEIEALGSNRDKQPVVEKRIEIPSTRSPIKAKKIKCPPIVASLYNPLRDKENSKLFRYVCYDERIFDTKSQKNLYTGCRLSNTLCRSESLYYFGHYNSDAEADDALRRCIASEPRKVH